MRLPRRPDPADDEGGGRGRGIPKTERSAPQGSRPGPPLPLSRALSAAALFARDAHRPGDDTHARRRHTRGAQRAHMCSAVLHILHDRGRARRGKPRVCAGATFATYQAQCDEDPSERRREARIRRSITHRYGTDVCARSPATRTPSNGLRVPVGYRMNLRLGSPMRR